MTDEIDEIELSEAERCSLGSWAAECAARALPLFEEKAPLDNRPRAAIEGIRVFADGGKRTAQLRDLAWAAHKAAREIEEPAATAAARAASLAAAVAYIHARATPHQSKHLLGPAVYAARARELALDEASAAEEELAWAIEAAPPRVRDVLRRFPARSAGRSRLESLFYRLDMGLRNQRD